jgi:excisionase family DNA binding protein
MNLSEILDQLNKLEDTFLCGLQEIRSIKAEIQKPATNLRGTPQVTVAARSFLTVKQAAEASGLSVSTIRLAIRRRQLRAQRVGRRVLVKRIDLEGFLEASPITVLPDKSA